MGTITGGRVIEGVDREDRAFHVRAYYDFAVHTGAIGSYNLVDEAGRVVYLPDNLVIERSTLEVITALAGNSGATIAFGTSQSGKGAILLAATGFGTAPFDGADKVGAAAAALPAKVATAAIALTAAVATATLTAGKVAIEVTGFIGD